MKWQATIFHAVYRPMRWVVLSMSLCISTVAIALEADLGVTQFQTIDKPYIEVFLYILGHSVHAKTGADSSQTASVNVTYFITDQNTVIAGDRYNLVSSGKPIADFMDLRRHFLSPGTYTVTVELTDNFDTTNTLTLIRQCVIRSTVNTLTQSDILLLGHITAATQEEVWVRSGWRMTPLPYAWYRPESENLYFYHELYHTDVSPASDFYIRYSISPLTDKSKILLQSFKRLKPQQVNTIMQPIDIKGLSSGEYALMVGVYDQNRQLLSETEKMFIRTNPEADEAWVESSGQIFEESFVRNMDADSVRYALKAIAPKISQIQVPVLNYLLEKGELENQQRFLHQYWVETDPLTPEESYRKYMEIANHVDQEYHSAFGFGFETDRGHILLKYGTPDDIIAVDDEPTAPPYEIWIYHSFPVTNQSNVRFLFYNPSLAGGDYQLLHSTAIGEVNNYRWQMELYKDALSEPEGGDFIDAVDVRDNFNRRAVEYFND